MNDDGREAVKRVTDFFDNFICHTKGKWAGRKFKMLDWQLRQVVEPYFGTLRSDGRRKYRVCYVEIPKKNGKTEFGGGLALYGLCADREYAPEVYSAAGDKEQASLVYNAAETMVIMNDELSARLEIRKSRKRINYPKAQGYYQVLSAEAYTKHGLNPSCIIFDELHAQPDDELWNVLYSGTDYAREQQMFFVLTTAGEYDQESIWWKMRTRARQIAAGIISDPTFLPVLYIADPESDDPHDELVWIRNNPALGTIFPIEKIREDYEQAKLNPVDFQNFLRFRLNIPVKQLSRWLPLEIWDKNGGVIEPDRLVNRVCYGGLDLSSKIDLSAFVLVFPPETPDEKIVIVPHFWVPEDTIMKRAKADKVHYEVWANQGFLTATPGDVIDNDFIIRHIREAMQKYRIMEIGFDPWGANDIATKLYNESGLNMVEMRQGSRTLSEPAKDLYANLAMSRFNHGHNPILRWCADNIVMSSDANENIRPMKDKASDRIDGMVALIMAWGRAMFSDAVSHYEKEKIMIG